MPESYLASFADSRRRIKTYDLDESRAFVRSTVETATTNDFYTVEDEGAKSDRVEQAFSQLEGPGADAIRRILNGSFPPTSVDRAVLAFTVAFQHLRTPAGRYVDTTMNDFLLKFSIAVKGPEGLRDVLDANGETVTDEDLVDQWQHLVAFGDWELGYDQKRHVEAIAGDAWNIMAELTKLNWLVVRFDRRCLLMSDSPVSIFSETGSPVGLLNADEIWLPLSRRVALCLSSAKGEDGKEIIPTANLARHINELTVQTADRYVFCHPEDDFSAEVNMQRATREQRYGLASFEEYARLNDSPDVPELLERLKCLRDVPLGSRRLSITADQMAVDATVPGESSRAFDLRS